MCLRDEVWCFLGQDTNNVLLGPRVCVASVRDKVAVTVTTGRDKHADKISMRRTLRGRCIVYIFETDKSSGNHHPLESLLLPTMRAGLLTKIGRKHPNVSCPRQKWILGRFYRTCRWVHCSASQYLSHFVSACLSGCVSLRVHYRVCQCREKKGLARARLRLSQSGQVSRLHVHPSTFILDSPTSLLLLWTTFYGVKVFMHKTGLGG